MAAGFTVGSDTGTVDIKDLKLFQMAMTRMEWAAQRQKVLAQNIVNADTPDYRPSDVKDLNFKRELRQAAPVNVARTNPAHLPGTIPERDSFQDRKIRKTFEVSPDGNQVILEEQMQKVGDTRGDYNTAITLMQSHMKMLKLALGKGGSSSGG